MVRDDGSATLSSAYLVTPKAAVGQVVIRSIAPGELIPRASLASASEVIETSVVVELQTPIPLALKPGDIVDLWGASKVSSSSSLNAQVPGAHRIVARARLANVTSSSALEASAQRVDLVVERDEVAAVLDAQARGLGMYLVPSAGGLG
jgi:flagella basal body P-ring formation protein FlgA